MIIQRENQRGEIMYCWNCGRKIKKNELFCPDCGSKLDVKEDVQSTDLEIAQETYTNKKANQKNKKNKPRKKKSALLTVVLTCLVIALGFVAVGGMIIYNYGCNTLIGVQGALFGINNLFSIGNDSQYLAVVKDENGKFGYINEKLEEVIPCNYEYATDFQLDGTAVVVNNAYESCVINKKGECMDTLKEEWDENGYLYIRDEYDEDSDYIYGPEGKVSSGKLNAA